MLVRIFGIVVPRLVPRIVESLFWLWILVVVAAVDVAVWFDLVGLVGCCVSDCLPSHLVMVQHDYLDC